MHGNIATILPIRCRMVDQPAAALVKDLKQRGLLDDTLVIFGSEFGRTSFAQGQLKSDFGRDHHGGSFTWWMAGGGVKAGYTHGETDDFSYNIVKDPVHIHDLQRHDPAHARHRSHEADLPLPGARLPSDRRAWQRGEGAAHLSCARPAAVH